MRVIKSGIDDAVRLSAEQRQAAEEKLQKAAEDGRVPCANALAIARELKVPSREVGRLADHLGLRICQCQLNCF